MFSLGAEKEAELGPFRALSVQTSAKLPSTNSPSPPQAGLLLSLWREIPMDIARDCSKCGFPVDEAAQVLRIIAPTYC